MSYRHILGAEELARKLKEAGPKLEKRVMRKAVKAAAAVFVKKARKNVSRVAMSGKGRQRLRSSIRAAGNAKGKPGTVVAGVYFKKNPKPRIVKRGGRDTGIMTDDPAVWGKWFEGGTADRFRGSKSKAAKARRLLTGSKRGYTGAIKRQSFIEKAFDEGVIEATETAIKVARETAEKELGK